MINILIFFRIGCLLNGCCAGRPSTGRLALHLPNHRGVWRRRIPTQLLEAAWAALLLVAAIALWRRLPFDGALFLSAIAGYGIGRLVLESTRERQDRRIGGATLQRAILLALVVLSAGPLLLLWLSGWRL